MAASDVRPVIHTEHMILKRSMGPSFDPFRRLSNPGERLGCRRAILSRGLLTSIHELHTMGIGNRLSNARTIVMIP